MSRVGESNGLTRAHKSSGRGVDQRLAPLPRAERLPRPAPRAGELEVPAGELDVAANKA